MKATTIKAMFAEYADPNNNIELEELEQSVTEFYEAKLSGREPYLISVGFEQFVEEILPRTVKGYYKGRDTVDQYLDFQKRSPNAKILFVKAHGVGEMTAVKIYLD